MTIVPIDYLHSLVRRRTTPLLLYRRLARRLRLSTTKLALILLSILLLGGSFAAYTLQSNLLAPSNETNRSCGWRTVEAGDTLSFIARQYHTTISILVHANGIRNPNLIFVGQRLCIPHNQGSTPSSKGILTNGTIVWYDSQALGWSTRSQVHNLLRQVAASHHLPYKLLLAIAWEESGWTQHVIARDGGIGVMQLMPGTAMGINAGLRKRLNPYQLLDNLNLGATYLQWLWQSFHGNLTKVISAYNEGGWSVIHRGIFNWRYVNNVLALMKRLN
jgi:hypothetical protein